MSLGALLRASAREQSSRPLSALLATTLLAVAVGACSQRASTSTGTSVQLDAVVAEEPEAGAWEAWWRLAGEGDELSLVRIAREYGARRLVAQAGRPSMHRAAVGAMAFAEGWSQAPYLVKLMHDGDDADSALAGEALERRASEFVPSRDLEDLDEIREACTQLEALVASKKTRVRRASALRALRVMPCPRAVTERALERTIESD